MKDHDNADGDETFSRIEPESLLNSMGIGFD